MKKISAQSYFVSAPVPYEGWHARHKIEYINYFPYYFKNDNKLIISANKDNNLFSKSDSLQINHEVDYSIKGNIIEVINQKGFKFASRVQLTVFGVDKYLDKSSVEYR